MEGHAREVAKGTVPVGSAPYSSAPTPETGQLPSQCTSDSVKCDECFQTSSVLRSTGDGPTFLHRIDATSLACNMAFNPSGCIQRVGSVAVTAGRARNGPLRE